ncbi:DUF2516 family protein [Actinoplanes sp. NPDC051851]|uniref:DUF2516 family protein n=1 Tax=Actinoplanes sp. NPDC051851 TaxID=3154753 RepID=UPI00343EC20F
MAYSAPIFYATVVVYIMLAVKIFSLAIQVAALIHCLTQRGAGFSALGTLPKGAWAGILAVLMVLTAITSSPFNLFSLAGIAAAMIYLLDVRPGLKDIAGGKGPW